MENAPHLLVRCSLIYIYLTRNHTLVSCYPIGRGIVVFDFFSLLSFFFFFSFPPLAFQPASHQIEQFSRCSCSPCYSSPCLFSTFHDSSKIPSLNHSHLEILNYRISRERIQKLSNPIDYAYSSKDCSTVKKKKERKKKTRRDGHEGVELYSTSLPRERGKARGPFARLFGKGKRRSRERGNAWGDWRSKRRGEVL